MNIFASSLFGKINCYMQDVCIIPKLAVLPSYTQFDPVQRTGSKSDNKFKRLIFTHITLQLQLSKMSNTK